jgi:UTP-glucose-1-phosphate uridylyltransferase
MAAHESHGKSCIPLRTVYRLEAGDYVFDAEKLPNGLYAVHDVVRSSTAGNGEPRFRGMGRSVLTAEVFDYLPKEFSQQRELTTLPYLLGLARAGRLLGIRVDPNVPLVHLGECGAPEPEKEQ